MKKYLQRLLAAVAALVFLCIMPLAVMAAAPQAVRDSRHSVVRVYTEGTDSGAIGSGFAVGTSINDYVIITNHHVVDLEGFLQAYVSVETGVFIEVDILAVDITRDLAILKPKSEVKGLELVALESRPLAVGDDAYALGFPGAGDDMNANYRTGIKERVTSIDSMSMTFGIISAFRTTNVFGDGSRSVESVQTDTAISGGNSGGPLMNDFGFVIAINTLGSGSDSNMNLSLHVKELMTLLDEKTIKYTTSEELLAAASSSAAQQPESAGLGWLWILIILILIVIVVVIIVMGSKSKKKNVPPPNGAYGMTGRPYTPQQQGQPMYGTPNNMQQQGRPQQGMPNGMARPAQLPMGAPNNMQQQGQLPQGRPNAAIPQAQWPMGPPNVQQGQPQAMPNAAAQRPMSPPNAQQGQPQAMPNATAQRPMSPPNAQQGQPQAMPNATVQRPTSPPNAQQGQPQAVPNAAVQRPTSPPNVQQGQPQAMPNAAAQLPMGAPNAQQGQPQAMPSASAQLPTPPAVAPDMPKQPEKTTEAEPSTTPAIDLPANSVESSPTTLLTDEPDATQE